MAARTIWVVEWLGIFGYRVHREFDTRERAEQWARQCGRFRDCEIFHVSITSN